MNLKKILTGVVAGAMAVSAMSVASFADIVGDGVDAKGTYSVNVADILPKGVEISEVYGATVYIKPGYSMAEGQGGAIAFNSEAGGWDSVEWGNKGSDKPIVLDEENNSITRLDKEPFFTVADLVEGSWAQVQLQQYWGADIEVEKTVLLDKDGKELKAKEDEPAPDDTDEPAPAPDDTNEPAPAPDDTNEPAPAPDDTQEPAPSDTDESMDPVDTKLYDVAISGNDKHDAPLLSVDGDDVRLNIVHPWSDGEFVFADYKAFTGVSKIQVVVTVKGVTEAFDIQLMGMSGDAFGIWGKDDDKGTSTVVTVDKDGTYTLELTTLTPIAENKDFFLMVGTTLKAVEATVTRADDKVVPEGLTMTLDKLSVNVEQKAADNNDGTTGTEPDPSGSGDNNGNKPTGIAIAIVPAVIAATGVIVAKKRK